MARIEDGGLNIEPGAGRDYASPREARRALDGGEKFVVQGGEGEWSGRIVTLEALRAAGVKAVHVHFRGGRQTHRFELR